MSSELVDNFRQIGSFFIGRRFVLLLVVGVCMFLFGCQKQVEVDMYGQPIVSGVLQDTTDGFTRVMNLIDTTEYEKDGIINPNYYLGDVYPYDGVYCKWNYLNREFTRIVADLKKPFFCRKFKD